MKIDNYITGVNNNPTYSSFLPITLHAYKRFNFKVVCGYVRSNDKSQDDKLIDIISSSGAQVHVFDRISNIDYGVQTKISRLFLASTVSGNNCIVDIDMIPLSIKIPEAFYQVPEDHLGQFGYDHPAYHGPIKGWWQMDKTTASKETFSDIINPDNLNYVELLQSWHGSFKHLPPDLNRADVSEPFSFFRDEGLLKCLWDRWSFKDSKTTKLKRQSIGPGFNTAQVYGRLCRRHTPNLVNVDISKWFEAHGPRPFNLSNMWYQPILQHLGYAGK
jgi:hypothetical protein